MSVWKPIKQTASPRTGLAVFREKQGHPVEVRSGACRPSHHGDTESRSFIVFSLGVSVTPWLAEVSRLMLKFGCVMFLVSKYIHNHEYI